MRIISIFFIVLLLAYPVFSSAGVRGPALELRQFDFEPGKVVQTNFYIFGADRLDLMLTGGMVKNAEVIDPEPGGGPRTITVQLTMPDYLPPGEHKLYVGSLEKTETGQVGGRAGAMMSIRVRVLADFPAIKHEFSVDNTALNANTTMAHLAIESWTTQDMQVGADIIIYDANGNTELRRIRAPQMDLPSNQKREVDITLSTDNLARGYYKTDAHIYYGLNTTIAEDGFLIGDVDVLLKEYTQVLTYGKINKFTLSVQSDWNQQMDYVSAQLFLDNKEVGKSPSVILKPFSDAQMDAFVDTKDLNITTYNGTLQINFMNRQKKFPVTIKIVEEETPAAAQVQQTSKLGIPINSMTILYFLVVLLVLVNFYLVFRTRKKE